MSEINYNQNYRVFNKCKFDIGVQLLSGRQINIKPGSFQLIDANDILYIESVCVRNKLFAQKMLVAVGADGKEVPLESIGIVKDEDTKVHLDDNEIEAALKQNFKKFEQWVNDIEDPSELHAIYKIAKTLDLPASKLKILKAKMPNKDWLDEE